MRHKIDRRKLGLPSDQRRALLTNLARQFVRHGYVHTTVGRSKELRRIVEQLITLGKQGTLAARRRAISTLRNEDAVRELFSKVAPAFNDRKGGYTRIFKLGRRSSDSSEMALLEFVDYILPVKADPEAKDTKPAKKTAPRKKAAAAADKAE